MFTDVIYKVEFEFAVSMEVIIYKVEFEFAVFMEVIIYKVIYYSSISSQTAEGKC